LKSKKLSRLKSIEEHAKPSSDVSEEHFSRFRVDKTACGICGTNFKVSTDEHVSISHVESEDDPDVSNQQTKESTPEIETAEEHQKSPAHLQKEQEFQTYKGLYKAEILPCLMKDDELRKTVEGNSASGDRGRMEGVEFDLERLERYRYAVNSDVQVIESSLQWTNRRSLWSAIKEFKDELKNMEKLLEQAKADSLTAEQEDEEEIEEYISEEEQEGKIMEMHQQDEGKKRKKPKRRRKR